MVLRIRTRELVGGCAAIAERVSGPAGISCRGGGVVIECKGRLVAVDVRVKQP